MSRTQHRSKPKAERDPLRCGACASKGPTFELVKAAHAPRRKTAVPVHVLRTSGKTGGIYMEHLLKKNSAKQLKKETR